MAETLVTAAKAAPRNTIVLFDLYDSVRYAQEHSEGIHESRERFRSMYREILTEALWNALPKQDKGDGYFLVFAEPRDAHDFAVRLLQKMQARNHTQIHNPYNRLWCRIGVATGMTTVWHGEDGWHIDSLAMSVVARLEQYGTPGAVHIDLETYHGLPTETQALYGQPTWFAAKGKERYDSYLYVVDNDFKPFFHPHHLNFPSDSDYVHPIPRVAARHACLEAFTATSPRLLVLWGPGGIGKTFFARQISDALLEKYPHSVHLFIPFNGATSVNDILRQLRRVVDIEAIWKTENQSIATRARQIAEECFRYLHCYLYLDDLQYVLTDTEFAAESALQTVQEDEVRQFIKGCLEAGSEAENLHIIATSHVKYEDSRILNYRIPSFALSEAYDYLRTRLGDSLPKVEEEAEALCRRIVAACSRPLQESGTAVEMVCFPRALDAFCALVKAGRTLQEDYILTLLASIENRELPEQDVILTLSERFYEKFTVADCQVAQALAVLSRWDTDPFSEETLGSLTTIEPKARRESLIKLLELGILGRQKNDSKTDSYRFTDDHDQQVAYTKLNTDTAALLNSHCQAARHYAREGRLRTDILAVRHWMDAQEVNEAVLGLERIRNRVFRLFLRDEYGVLNDLHRQLDDGSRLTVPEALTLNAAQWSEVLYQGLDRWTKAEAIAWRCVGERDCKGETESYMFDADEEANDAARNEAVARLMKNAAENGASFVDSPGKYQAALFLAIITFDSYGDWETARDIALALPPTPKAPERNANRLCCLGIFHNQGEEYEEAIQCYESALNGLRGLERAAKNDATRLSLIRQDILRVRVNESRTKFLWWGADKEHLDTLERALEKFLQEDSMYAGTQEYCYGALNLAYFYLSLGQLTHARHWWEQSALLANKETWFSLNHGQMGALLAVYADGQFADGLKTLLAGRSLFAHTDMADSRGRLFAWINATSAIILQHRLAANTGTATEGALKEYVLFSLLEQRAFAAKRNYGFACHVLDYIWWKLTGARPDAAESEEKSPFDDRALAAVEACYGGLMNGGEVWRAPVLLPGFLILRSAPLCATI